MAATNGPAEPKDDGYEVDLPKVRECEITEDGFLVVEFDRKIEPGFNHTKRAVFDPEALYALVCAYGEIPPAEETEFAGIPHVEYEDVFPDDDEDDVDPMEEVDQDIEESKDAEFNPDPADDAGKEDK